MKDKDNFIEEEVDESDSVGESDEKKKRVLSRRGRPRKTIENRLGLAKDTYLGYKIEKGMYVYSDDQIKEALFDMCGNHKKTADYLQIHPRWLYERIAQNPELKKAQLAGKEIFDEFVESEIMDLCLRGNERMLIYWDSNKSLGAKTKSGEINKNLNMQFNVNVDLQKLSVEELKDVREKLLSTINPDNS